MRPPFLLPAQGQEVPDYRERGEREREREKRVVEGISSGILHHLLQLCFILKSSSTWADVGVEDMRPIIQEK